MNFFKKYRNFPELGAMNDAMEAQKLADKNYLTDMNEFFGSQYDDANKELFADYESTLSEIKETNKEIQSGQEKHIEQTKDVYNDILKMSPYHDRMVEKKKCLDATQRDRDKTVETLKKVGEKYNSTQKDTPEYKAIAKEYVKYVKEEKAVVKKFETENINFKKDNTEYQENFVVALSSDFIKDLESRAELATHQINTGMKIQKLVSELVYVDHGRNHELDDEIDVLTQIINQGA